MSKFKTLERKKQQAKNEKNPASCYHFDTAVSFVSLLILGCTFAAKSTIEKLNVAKNLPNFFFGVGNFLYSQFKNYVFMSQILFLIAKCFILD